MAFKVDPKLAEDYQKFKELSQREDIKRLYDEEMDYIVCVEMEMTARWEKGYKEGLEIGRRIAKEKMKAEERLILVKNLINLGMGDEAIMELMDMDLETVIEIRSEINSQ